MRGLGPAAGVSLEPQRLVGVVPTTGARQGQWGLLLERLSRATAAVAHILCVPHGTRRQIPGLMSRRGGTGLGHLCSSCSPEGCVRQCFLSVSTCVARWVGSVSARVQLSGVGAQPLFCLHSGTGNTSSPTSMGLRQEESPWLPLPIRFSYL